MNKKSTKRNNLLLVNNQMNFSAFMVSNIQNFNRKIMLQKVMCKKGAKNVDRLAHTKISFHVKVCAKFFRRISINKIFFKNLASISKRYKS